MKMSKVEAGVRAALRFYEAFNRHDVPALLAVLSDDCRFESHEPAPDGRVYEGHAAIAVYWAATFGARPDVHCEVEEVFGFGYRAVARWRRSWMDQDGVERHLYGVDILRMHDDLITEMASYGKA